MSNHDRHGQHRYGSLHKKVRRQFVLRMGRGEVFNCWRCGLPITGPWDLGHVDSGQGVAGRWPEHRACNRRTLTHLVAKYGSLGGAGQKRVRPEPAQRSSREW